MNSEKIIWTGPAVEELNQALTQMNAVQDNLTIDQEAEFSDADSVSDYGIVPISSSMTYAEYISSTAPKSAPVSQVILPGPSRIGSPLASATPAVSNPPQLVGVTKTTVPDPSNPGVSSVNTIQPPTNVTILNELTTKKIDSNGNLYIYVTVEFDEAPGITDYAVRLARA